MKADSMSTWIVLALVSMLLIAGLVSATWYSKTGEDYQVDNWTYTEVDANGHKFDINEADIQTDNVTSIDVEIVSEGGNIIDMYDNLTYTHANTNYTYDLTDQYGRGSETNWTVNLTDGHTPSDISYTTASDWNNGTEFVNVSVVGDSIELDSGETEGYWVSAWHNETVYGYEFKRIFDNITTDTNVTVEVRENATDSFGSVVTDYAYSTFQINITIDMGDIDFDIEYYQSIDTGSGHSVHRMDFSHDNSYLAVTTQKDDADVVIYYTSNWTVAETLTQTGYGSVPDVSWSHNDSLLAVAITSGVSVGLVRIYDTSDFSVVTTISPSPSRGRVNEVDFNHNSSLLAFGCRDDYVLIYDTSDWTLDTSISTPTSEVHTCSFSDDGYYLGYGQSNGMFKVVWTSNWSEAFSVDEGSNVYSIAWDSTGTFVATATGDPITYMYYVGNWTLYASLTEATGIINYDVDFSHDGEYIVYGSYTDECAFVHAVSNTTLMFTLTEPTHFVQGVAFSRDSVNLVLGSLDHHIYIYNTTYDELADNSVSSLNISFKDAGNMVVTVYDDSLAVLETYQYCILNGSEATDTYSGEIHRISLTKLSSEATYTVHIHNWYVETAITTVEGLFAVESGIYNVTMDYVDGDTVTFTLTGYNFTGLDYVWVQPTDVNTTVIIFTMETNTTWDEYEISSMVGIYDALSNIHFWYLVISLVVAMFVGFMSKSFIAPALAFLMVLGIFTLTLEDPAFDNTMYQVWLLGIVAFIGYYGVAIIKNRG